MASQPIRVLCVDDHPMVLEGLASVIGRQTDMELVAAAVSGEQGIAFFRRDRPDVTLMDLRLPAMTGIEAIRQIRSEDPAARIIALTMFQGDEDIHRALQAGASTYLLKGIHPDGLLSAIRAVHMGQCSLTPAVASLLAARESRPALTTREVEVVELIGKGRTNKEIAVELNLSTETVKVHVKNILAKLDARDRREMTSIAHRRGLIDLAKVDR